MYAGTSAGTEDQDTVNPLLLEMWAFGPGKLQLSAETVESAAAATSDLNNMFGCLISRADRGLYTFAVGSREGICLSNTTRNR